ncbi:MAG: MarR family winged helix-turn-helix transcriptional regulator [Pseudomonadota bacterium]
MLTTRTIESWTRLMRVSRAVMSAVEEDLKAAGLPSPLWYDTLLELSREAEGVRPYVLRERLMIPQYGVSRLIDRLVAEGLVLRKPCPEDGRGQVLSATDAGLELLDDMWPVYRDAIAGRFADKLGQDDLSTLGSILDRLAPDEA